MDKQDWLTERFEENRTHLRTLAYRMLGSRSEADDAVQEAWLRLSRSDASDVENLGGWLTTVVARVCLDMLRSRKSRREEPLDLDLSEPPRATVTLTRLSRYSTQTLWSEPTALRCRAAHRGRSAAQRPWPKLSRGVPEPHNRHS